jgi:hypothetical protein
VAIANQLYRELGGRLFQKLGMDPAQLRKAVLRLDGAVGGLLEEIDSHGAVIVATIQKAQRMQAHRSQAKHFANLKSLVDVVIFDEGHYEPARTWSDTVRSADVHAPGRKQGGEGGRAGAVRDQPAPRLT